jgi:hypothetical protein
MWAAVLVPLGIRESLRRHGMVPIAALLAVPVAAVLLDVERAADLVFSLLPFAALLSAAGLLGLGDLRPRARWTLLALLVICAILELTHAAK